MNKIYYFLCLILLSIFSVVFYLHIYNKQIRNKLLNILKLNSKNYLKNFVNMATKNKFKIKNIIDLIRIKFEVIQKEKINIEKNNFILNKAFNFVDEGILIVNYNYKIIFINNEMKNLFNITNVKDVLFKYIKDTCLNWLINFKDINSFEVPEKYCSINLLVNVLIDSNFKIYKFKNISEYKKLDSMSKEFISNITHELKTPLTSIIGFSETLKEVEEEENRQIFYEIINKEAVRLNNLISDILIFSEIETNNDINKQKINIINILERIKQLLIPQTNKVKFNITISGNKIFILNCEKYLYQIFLNIIDNSIKHSMGNNLNIKCSEDSKFVYISFEDDGIGIPEFEIQNIFNRFYRGSNSKSKSRGTGLGLCIVLSSIKKINGSIQVFNNKHKGVTFKITIPK